MSEPARTVPFRFEPAARHAIADALDELIPGCVELGALDYVEGLLGALDFDPPHIWAAPPDSGTDWLPLGPWERSAWAQRIETWRGIYEAVAQGEVTHDDRRVLYEHACEATYGDPAYGGNRGGGSWERIGFPEPMFPPSRPATVPSVEQQR